MRGMAALPAVVRSERQHAKRAPDEIVGCSRPEERAVAAVMENDKDPNQECSRQTREGHRQPPRNGQASVHEIPKHSRGNERVDDLPDGARGGRLLITGDNVLPRGRIAL